MQYLYVIPQNFTYKMEVPVLIIEGSLKTKNKPWLRLKGLY